jgi:uncharacterized protein (TIGR03086 family)
MLIEHGRDREAAELAASHLPAPIRGAPMDPRKQLDEILPLLTTLVARLDDSHLDLPTTCSEFAVRDVLAHMVGGASMFAAAFRGEAPSADAPDGTDVVATFPKAMADLQDAMSSPGALDRTIAAPFGDVPGDAFARFVALDGLVHGWDIATATNQPYDPPVDVVADVNAFARQAIAPEMRANGMFGAPTHPHPDASPLVQLVAFTGRPVG